ncbi:MAG: preprotein translocase subunit SecE [Parvularculaceae bacterium]|nr:preprotein translocase subunit SecE [Parvularculaceae bacterium]
MAKDAKPTADAKKPAATIEAAAEEVKKKKPFNVIKYFQEVRDEGRKVTWTSWKETRISTIMVLIMVAIMSAFFFLVDSILRVGVQAILNI